MDDNTKNHRLLDILFSLIKTDSRNQYYFMMESGSCRQEMKWVLSYIGSKKSLPSFPGWQSLLPREEGGGGAETGFSCLLCNFLVFALSPHISLSAGYRDKKKDSKMEDLFPRQRT